jgi:hypothetical protein
MKDQQERKAAEIASERRRRHQSRSQGNQPLMLGILALVSGYLWLGQPSFLEPKPLDPISAELSEASLRIEMSIFIGKIVQYQADNGRLPSSLSDAYMDRPGFLYQAEADGFSIEGAEGAINLEYNSGQDVIDFLGDAMQVVRGGAE